jgi:hypothetical protein
MQDGRKLSGHPGMRLMFIRWPTAGQAIRIISSGQVDCRQADSRPVRDGIS